MLFNEPPPKPVELLVDDCAAFDADGASALKEGGGGEVESESGAVGFVPNEKLFEDVAGAGVLPNEKDGVGTGAGVGTVLLNEFAPNPIELAVDDCSGFDVGGAEALIEGGGGEVEEVEAPKGFKLAGADIWLPKPLDPDSTSVFVPND